MKKSKNHEESSKMDEVAAIALTKAIIEFKNNAPNKRDPDPNADGWEGLLGIALNELREAKMRSMLA